ncbi:pyridoxine 5''-phosphate synthase [secondary endosymbiont of Heteropsylla cubana]|uniref:Pyridoxine 5'-phosphate synthase n=1 Tax=secondary endosymbiont of Heteropsylla cubana TaxID=134287 RepID=J3Z5B6_9ENTR|nr:pyridoxine 5'-phosphate synthase [secondary endosymbiont of Heteropsylla cubana]AFP85514.1 pyridoxine 5''-phosphate synthase [secondary endosymbiont of Heteropsylla cubana]
MSELLLGVNIDHVGTLRNMRNTTWPDPIQAAFIAEEAGADGITVHLREDRRHITDRDIQLLKKTLHTRMNLEMAVTKEMISIACDVIPDCCCLVPEKREEITTEGGLDILNRQDEIQEAIMHLRNNGIKVSLFIDPDQQQIIAAEKVGASCIEIHTGTFANAKTEICRASALLNIRQNIDFAVQLGLQVNAGHGLHYYNVKPIAALMKLQELNIGHAIISRALISGLGNAVKEMKLLMREARN